MYKKRVAQMTTLERYLVFLVFGTLLFQFPGFFNVFDSKYDRCPDWTSHKKELEKENYSCS